MVEKNWKGAFFSLLFLAGCSSPHLAEPDGCTPNQAIEKIELENICVDSMRCVKDEVAILSSYACFCDGVCLCFFSVTDDCSFKDKECKKHSGLMAIMPSNFCLLEGKQDILREFSEEVAEMI